MATAGAPLPPESGERGSGQAQGQGARRRVRIVATLGPATSEEGVLRRLLAAGVDVVRLNFSHGSHQEHARAIAAVRRIAGELDRHVAILQDLQGPKIRTGPLTAGEPVQLQDGARFTITTRSLAGDASSVSTSYEHLPQDVRPGDRILLADGLLELRVVAVEGPDVVCEVVHGGLLGEHKGINLPGAAVSAPALTEKDREDLVFGLAQGVDYVALSFVRRPEDIAPVRELMEQRGVHVPVIAKIEKPEALTHLEAVLRAFDGAMVARGDLGVELSPEEVPVWQKRIIYLANQLGKPVITATQMLESMTANPRPTRAEASDVANAVFDGSDAVMLSGETAVGGYPVETVETMARILQAAEAAVIEEVAPEPLHSGIAQAVSVAACTLAQDLDAAALVVITQSGRTGQLVSKTRPRTPIIAVAGSEAVAQRLALWWGITTLVVPFRRTSEEMLTLLDELLPRTGLVRPGATVVVVGSTPIAARGHTNFLKVHHLARAGQRATD